MIEKGLLEIFLKKTKIMNNQKLVTTVRKGIAWVKEQKNSIGVEVSGKYPNLPNSPRVLRLPPSLLAFFGFTISIGIAFIAALFNWISAYIGLPYFVTNRTVGYKYINILCLFCGVI